MIKLFYFFVAPERDESPEKFDKLSNQSCIGGVSIRKSLGTPEIPLQTSQNGIAAFQRLQTEFSTGTPKKPLVEGVATFFICRVYICILIIFIMFTAPQTPKNNIHTPESCSQVTPVNKIMEQFRQKHLNADTDSPLPRAITHVDTPETPLGAFIEPNPSRSLRKEMARYLNTFPEWRPPPERRLSTVMCFFFKLLLSLSDLLKNRIKYKKY